jgi:nitrate reductase (NAD(P)H)
MQAMGSVLTIYLLAEQPVGQHVFVRLRRKVKRNASRHDEVVLEGEMIQRAYTPVSLSDAKGEIDLLIKLYLAGSNNLVGGKMTTSVPGSQR